MRRRAAALTTEPKRLISNQAVLPIDYDLLPERPSDRVCCGGQAHTHSIARQRAPASGPPGNVATGKYVLASAPIGALSADGWRPVLRSRLGHLTTSTDDRAWCATRRSRSKRPKPAHTAAANDQQIRVAVTQRITGARWSITSGISGQALNCSRTTSGSTW